MPLPWVWVFHSDFSLVCREYLSIPLRGSQHIVPIIFLQHPSRPNQIQQTVISKIRSSLITARTRSTLPNHLRVSWSTGSVSWQDSLVPSWFTWLPRPGISQLTKKTKREEDKVLHPPNSQPSNRSIRSLSCETQDENQPCLDIHWLWFKLARLPRMGALAKSSVTLHVRVKCEDPNIWAKIFYS